jgi:hypothetical protein
VFARGQTKDFAEFSEIAGKNYDPSRFVSDTDAISSGEHNSVVPKAHAQLARDLFRIDITFRRSLCV